MAKMMLEGEDQEAKWIHRDKLTQIEIQEYIDRGIPPPAELLHRAARREEQQPSRSRSRSTQARYTDTNSIDYKRQRLQSPDPPSHSPIDDDEPFVPEDPRSPEEIANDPYEYGAYSMSRLRASSSKIPLATSSPLPIPAEHLERDTPLRRKRGTSEDFDDEYTPGLRMRSRGNSVGSQVLLDDESLGNAQASPMKDMKPKARTPVNTNKIVNGKQRTPSSTAARVISTGSTLATRSGNNERPRTANRPEGDPPWMAQMYKPDPMLPPDQQMLPTHAKRMMAEQWEKDGKIGSVYDRELSPVQMYDEEEHQPVKRVATAESRGASGAASGEASGEASNNSQWPLKSTNHLEASKGPISEHAGYSTMPKVPRAPSAGPIPSARVQPRPEQEMQIEPEDEKKEKGGCGCCVVM